MAHSKQMNISSPTHHHIYQYQPSNQATQTVVETAIFCLPAYASYITSDKVDGRDQTQDKDRQLLEQNRLVLSVRDKTARRGRNTTGIDVHIDGETAVSGLPIYILRLASDAVDSQDEAKNIDRQSVGRNRLGQPRQDKRTRLGQDIPRDVQVEDETAVSDFTVYVLPVTSDVVGSQDDTQDTDGQLAGRNLGRTKRDNTTRLGRDTTDIDVHVEGETAVSGFTAYVLHVTSDVMDGKDDTKDMDRQLDGRSHLGQTKRDNTTRLGRDTTDIGVHMASETAVSCLTVRIFPVISDRADNRDETKDVDKQQSDGHNRLGRPRQDKRTRLGQHIPRDVHVEDKTAVSCLTVRILLVISDGADNQDETKDVDGRNYLGRTKRDNTTTLGRTKRSNTTRLGRDVPRNVQVEDETAVFRLLIRTLHVPSDVVDGQDETQDTDTQPAERNYLGWTKRDNTTRLGRDTTSIDVHADGETAVPHLTVRIPPTTSDGADNRDETKDVDKQQSDGHNRLGRSRQDKTTRLGQDIPRNVHVEDETTIIRLLIYTLHVTSDVVDGRDETRDTDGQLTRRNHLGQTKRDNTIRLGRDTTSIDVHADGETAVPRLTVRIPPTTSDGADNRDETKDVDGHKRLGRTKRDNTTTLGRTKRSNTTRLGRDTTGVDAHVEDETAISGFTVYILHIPSDVVDGQDDTKDMDRQLAGRNHLGQTKQGNTTTFGRTKRDNTTTLGRDTTDIDVHVEDKMVVFGLTVYILYILSDSVNGQDSLRDEDKQPNENNYSGPPRRDRTVRFGRDATGTGVHLTDETIVSLAFVYSLIAASRQDQDENTDLDRLELYRLCPRRQGGDT